MVDGALVLLAHLLHYHTAFTFTTTNPTQVLYLALEKRYNFSLDDLDVVANGYSHFCSYLRDEECDGIKSASLRVFIGKRIDLSDIPQYLQEYERGNDVELWEIKYVKTNQTKEIQ